MGVGVGHRTWMAALAPVLLSVALLFAQENALANSTAPSQDAKSSAQQNVEATPTIDSLGKKEISQEALRELVRRAMENDQENYKKQKDLTHIERQKIDHLDSNGNLKKSETDTKEILILYGDRMERTIERDDRPLSPEERRKEDGKFDKEVEKLQKELPGARQKRIEKYEEESKKEREFVREVSNAFDFKLEGEESVNGRPAYVISGEPRRDYRPTSREGKILSKTHGKVWIDIASTHWVKLDVEFTDTMSFGWFLARVRPGTRVQVEQRLFRDEVWVPDNLEFKLDARVGLFKQLFQNVSVTFRDWRQFSSESRIIDYSELEQKRQSPEPESKSSAPQKN